MVVQKERTTKHNPQGFGYRMLELKSLGLDPVDAKRLLIFLAGLRKTRGIGGAVAYCSALEIKSKASLNGDPQPQTDVWVSKCVDGFPPRLKFLRKYAAGLRRRMVPLKRLFHVDSFTEANINKFFATCQPKDDGGYEDSLKPVLGILDLGIDFLKREVMLPSFTTYSHRTADYAEYVMLKHMARGEKGPKLERAVGMHILRDMQHLMYASHLKRNIYIDAALRKFKMPLGIDHLLHQILNGSGDLRDFGLNAGDPHPSAVGSVFASSEPGLKLRVFASPRLIYQAALKPLFDILMDALRVLPSDCTENQESGAFWVQEQMKQGKMVHSVDTMAATDSFPYSAQRFVLKKFRVDSHLISILDHCVDSRWVLPRQFKTNRQTISWTRGQPLGLLPSFALYAFTHNLLLIGLCVKFKRPIDCFRILGDDVVISDDIIHRRYREVLNLMKVGISEMKSFSSTGYAEFAGYYITADSMERAGKFRPLTSDNLLSKMTDPRTVLPELLVPKRIRSKMRHMMETEFPEGLLPLTDASLASKSDHEVYDLIEKLLCDFGGEMIHLETATWRTLKFNFEAILSKGYTDTQYECERFLDRNVLGKEFESDCFDITRFDLYERHIVPYQFDVFERIARICYHVITHPHKDSIELRGMLPCLDRLEGGLSRMSILKYILNCSPLSRPLSAVDGWSVLARIQKGSSGKDILETSRTVIRHWRNSSKMA